MPKIKKESKCTPSIPTINVQDFKKNPIQKRKDYSRELSNKKKTLVWTTSTPEKSKSTPFESTINVQDFKKNQIQQRADYCRELLKQKKQLICTVTTHEEAFITNLRQPHQQPVEPESRFRGRKGPKVVERAEKNDVKVKRIERRNERERNRIHKLTNLYEKLLECIPCGDDLPKQCLKLNRLVILIHAINYIKALQHLLTLDDPSICIDAQQLQILSHQKKLVTVDQYDLIFKKRVPNRFAILLNDCLENNDENDQNLKNVLMQSTVQENVTELNTDQEKSMFINLDEETMDALIKNFKVSTENKAQVLRCTSISEETQVKSSSLIEKPQTSTKSSPMKNIPPIIAPHTLISQEEKSPTINANTSYVSAPQQSLNETQTYDTSYAPEKPQTPTESVPMENIPLIIAPNALISQEKNSSTVNANTTDASIPQQTQTNCLDERQANDIPLLSPNQMNQMIENLDWPNIITDTSSQVYSSSNGVQTMYAPYTSTPLQSQNTQTNSSMLNESQVYNMYLFSPIQTQQTDENSSCSNVMFDFQGQTHENYSSLNAFQSNGVSYTTVPYQLGTQTQANSSFNGAPAVVFNPIQQPNYVCVPDQQQNQTISSWDNIALGQEQQQFGNMWSMPIQQQYFPQGQTYYNIPYNAIEQPHQQQQQQHQENSYNNF